MEVRWHRGYVKKESPLMGKVLVRKGPSFTVTPILMPAFQSLVGEVDPDF